MGGLNKLACALCHDSTISNKEVRSLSIYSNVAAVGTTQNLKTIFLTKRRLSQKNYDYCTTFLTPSNLRKNFV